jgi:hypothetical protein
MVSGIKLYTGAALLLVATMNAATAADAVNSYEVLRNGKEIGTHDISFHREGETLKVVSETRMKVKFLFITAYKYHYRSTERWTEAGLESVVTKVDDNGKVSETEIRREGDIYLAEDSSGQVLSVDPGFMTTNHWNADVLGVDTLFNTITGRLNEVRIGQAENRESTIADGETYAVRGELEIDTAYDQKGNWLGMSFRHTDGSLIEFRCTSCTNTLDLAL